MTKRPALTGAGDLDSELLQNDLCAGGFDSAVISIKRSDQLVAVLYEHRQISLDRTQDHTVAHFEILVCQKIAEVDDLTALRDCSKELGITLGNHLEGTSKNQEFHSYRSLKKTPCGAKGFNKLYITMTELTQPASY